MTQTQAPRIILRQRGPMFTSLVDGDVAATRQTREDAVAAAICLVWHRDPLANMASTRDRIIDACQAIGLDPDTDFLPDEDEIYDLECTGAKVIDVARALVAQIDVSKVALAEGVQ